ncbi:MAG TPA: hypothetical protein VKQ52_04565 [Puia sp.]|nr:hypothetical protein [Puia sp.]
MKRAFLFVALPFFVLAACKKNNTSSAATGISATINGKKVIFNGITRIDTSGGNLYISCSVDSLTFGSPLITLFVQGTRPLKTGLYPNLSLAPRASFQSDLSYATYQGYTSQQYQSYDDSVTVSFVNNSSASGTFSGRALYSDVDPGDAGRHEDRILTITDGKFNVRW